MCPGSLDVCCKDPDFYNDDDDLGKLVEEETGYGEVDYGYGGVDDGDDHGKLEEAESQEEAGGYGGYGGDDDDDVSDEDSSEEVSEQLNTDDGYSNTDDYVVNYVEEDDESECGYSEPCTSTTTTTTTTASSTTTTTTTTTTTAKPERLVYAPQCGRRNVGGVGVRIQNNNDGEAQFGEWPHMCAVLKREVLTNQNRDK